MYLSMNVGEIYIQRNKSKTYLFMRDIFLNRKMKNFLQICKRKLQNLSEKSKN